VSNAFCDLFGVEHPIQLAAMSRVTTPELVAAVSNAGGLGMIGMGRTATDRAIARIDALEALTDRPYGAGFVVPFLERDRLEAIAARTRVIELSFDWPDSDLVLPGVITGWQIGTPDEARAAVDVGCGYVVAQGFEAGGHVRDTVPLDRLLPAVRAAVDVPVVATGGIGTRADVDRVFDLGADGVRLGTRFLAATEADVHPRYLELLIEAGPDDTVHTEAFGIDWPGTPHRILASALAEASRPGPDPVGHVGGQAIPRWGSTLPTRDATGQIEAMALYAGTSVGAVTGPVSAAEIVAELVGGRS
jgi:nitronate monooxygenase